MDANVTVNSPAFWGLTAGVQFNGKQANRYIGVSIGSPGISGALTYSPGDITPGFGAGFQVTVPGYSFQVGVANGDFFEEPVGIGYPAGVSFTAFYVFPSNYSSPVDEYTQISEEDMYGCIR